MRNINENVLTFKNEKDYKRALNELIRIPARLGIFKIIQLDDNFITIKQVADDQKTNPIKIARDDDKFDFNIFPDDTKNDKLEVGQLLECDTTWFGNDWFNNLKHVCFIIYSDPKNDKNDIMFNFNNIDDERNNWKWNDDEQSYSELMNFDDWKDEHWGSTSYPLFCDYDDEKQKIYFTTYSYSICMPLVEKMITSLDLKQVAFYTRSDQDDYGGTEYIMDKNGITNTRYDVYDD
ncbi:hypothetical protein DY052_07435 [Apilactobacillus timberlakei]|uniref:hypothetical protein n=1 Tax=Apilactobacillus timberlakei TaxID=2008380 RepID=UPI00112DC81D|nr:hypothetical protein [Apilactobacillus timberlakei]TPR13685.1 hypothetical protein DY052_07435 [Apilactobacillus timberlakei]